MRYDRLIVFTDGGAFNNPGPAGIGIVIANQQGKKLLEISKFIGFATNNQAEYQAVVFALKTVLEKFKAKNIQVLLDSNLVCQQLRGNYKVKNQGLKPLYNKVKELQCNFELVLFDHIPREKNKDADKLVKKAIKNHLKNEKK